MCIGTPMRALEAWNDSALASGRGRVEQVDTRLVGPCAPGDWLLVFQGAARERLDAQRAAEIDAALDLLEAGMAGDVDRAGADPGFALPSAMSAAMVAALAGQPAPGADADPTQGSHP
jgi:hydrogenase expression/formation protein HypC